MAAVAARLDQPGIGEHLQVLRHRAERDVAERAMDVTGCALLAPYEPQDLAAARLADRTKRVHG